MNDKRLRKRRLIARRHLLLLRLAKKWELKTNILKQNEGSVH